MLKSLNLVLVDGRVCLNMGCALNQGCSILRCTEN